jgi:hypothetical protein
MDRLRKYLLFLIIFHFSFFIFHFVDATSLTHVSDKISSSWPNVGVDHTIRFTVTTSIPGSGKIVITPEDGFFNIPSALDYTDLDFILNGVGKDLATSSAETVSGVEVISGSSGKITITLASGLSISSGDEIIVRIGKNAIHQVSGDQQITNPSTNGAYKINIQTFDSSLNLLDRANAMIAVLNPVSMGLTVEVIGPVCGNGIAESGEQCDGSDLGGQTCEGLGGTLSCKADCTFNTSGCTTEEEEAPSVGGVAPAPIATIVILEGWAYPKSKVTALKDGQVVKTVYANSKAEFWVEISNLTSGTYTFGVWAEDKNGRRSITYSLTFYVRANTTTKISGIFLPPTIDLSKTVLARGDVLGIFGQTVPESEVETRISSPGEEIIKKIKANEIGVWFLSFNTQPLEEGSHGVKARSQISSETISGFGHTLGFIIGKPLLCPRADLNKDRKTDLADYSILIFYWGTNNSCADQNQDGIVNIADFSIMMLWWGKVVELCPGSDLNKDSKINLIDFSILLYRWGTDDPCADQNQNGVVDLSDFSIMMYWWTG